MYILHCYYDLNLKFVSCFSVSSAYKIAMYGLIQGIRNWHTLSHL